MDNLPRADLAIRDGIVGAPRGSGGVQLPDLPDDARVLGFKYDRGERYLSVPDFLPES